MSRSFPLFVLFVLSWFVYCPGAFADEPDSSSAPVTLPPAPPPEAPTASAPLDQDATSSDSSQETAEQTGQVENGPSSHPTAPATSDPEQQNDVVETAISITAGWWTTLPDRSINGAEDITGSGLLVQAEWIYRMYAWFSPRVYGGLSLVSPDPSSCEIPYDPCDTSATVVFVGTKFRLMAPIPYVAPFLELGLGLSVGKIETQIGTFLQDGQSGFMYHVPWTLGLALGKDHDVEIGLSFLNHPTAGHALGGITIGLEFAL